MKVDDVYEGPAVIQYISIINVIDKLAARRLSFITY